MNKLVSLFMVFLSVGFVFPQAQAQTCDPKEVQWLPVFVYPQEDQRGNSIKLTENTLLNEKNLTANREGVMKQIIRDDFLPAGLMGKSIPELRVWINPCDGAKYFHPQKLLTQIAEAKKKQREVSQQSIVASEDGSPVLKVQRKRSASDWMMLGAQGLGTFGMVRGIVTGGASMTGAGGVFMGLPFLIDGAVRVGSLTAKGMKKLLGSDNEPISSQVVQTKAGNYLVSGNTSKKSKNYMAAYFQEPTRKPIEGEGNAKE